MVLISNKFSTVAFFCGLFELKEPRVHYVPLHFLVLFLLIQIQHSKKDHTVRFLFFVVGFGV